MWFPADDPFPKSSFQIPVPIIGVEPQQSPCDCIRISSAYRQVIVGALNQLASPTAWDGTDPAAREVQLEQVQELLEVFGMADGCVEPPPFTPITEGDDIDCKIASYLVKTVVKETLQSAINVAFPVTGGVSILQHLIDAVPGVGDFLGWLGVGAKNAEVFITGAITLPWVETALEDAVWNAIGCAVYDGVKGVHKITDATLGPIRTVIEGLGIAFPDFLTAVSKIMGDIGADTLTAIAELATVTSYDCSHCGDSTPSITGTDGPVALPLPLDVSDGSTTVQRVSKIVSSGAPVADSGAWGDGRIATITIPAPLTVTDGVTSVEHVSLLGFPDFTVSNVDGAAVITYVDTDAPTLQLRLTSECLLQYSTDAGSSWSDVAGWDSYAATCFTGPPGTFTPGIPTNPLGLTNAQLACNIAGYLVATLIVQAVNTVATIVTDAETAQDAYNALVPLLPGSQIYLGTLAFATNALWGAISSGTVSHYTDATGDTVFKRDLACAIQSALSSVGYVSAANFSDMCAAIGAVSYTHAEVVASIASFVFNLGLIAAEEIQLSGVLYDHDCSDCGLWCYEFSVAAGNLGSLTAYDGIGSFDGTQWNAVPHATQISLFLTTALNPAATFTHIRVTPVPATPHNDFIRLYLDDPPTTGVLDTNDYDWYGSVTGALTMLIGDNKYVDWHIDSITFEGTGSNPFGVNNC